MPKGFLAVQSAQIPKFPIGFPSLKVHLLKAKSAADANSAVDHYVLYDTVNRTIGTWPVRCQLPS